MKLAFFSDIHANLPALEAVLADIDREAPDFVHCLGDLVGYNIWPNEVCHLIRQRGIPTLAGNYDLGVGLDSDDCGCAYKTEEERAWGAASIALSNALITPAHRAYLRQLWSQWWKVRNDCLRWLEDRQLPRWKLKTIRPGNHPQRRLGALGALLQAWPQVVAPLADATRWSQAAWRETLLGLAHDFWSTHYTLLPPPSPSPSSAKPACRRCSRTSPTRCSCPSARACGPNTSNSPPCSTIKKSAAPCSVSLATIHAAKTSPRSCTTSKACCKFMRTSASKTTPPARTARSRNG